MGAQKASLSAMESVESRLFAKQRRLYSLKANSKRKSPRFQVITTPPLLKKRSVGDLSPPCYPY
jgi:hypothetical protein